MLAAGMMAAHAGDITGTVIDKEMNEPLMGASIRIAGTRLGTTADINGKFRLRNLKKGTYTIEVSYVSFFPQKITLNVPAKGDVSVEVEMSPDDKQLNEVTVTARKNLELERLSNEKRLILIIVFASLLIIFLTASLWMIHQMLKSRKKDKELAQNLSLDYQASQEELQKKEKDLAAATLFAAQKDESLKNLKKQCTELLKQDMNTQQQAIVREMLQTINLCHYGSSWEEFRIRFDMAYPDFYKNLAETGVELTKSERYLAALLAININTKEISSMTQKSPRSVETYIYRLRKKLGIPTETKTHDYFHAFLGKEGIR